MSRPHNFSWVRPPHLAALGWPDGPDELRWLRAEGVQLLITMTESPVRRDWINDAGLFSLHLPVPDMCAPEHYQLEVAVSSIERAKEQDMGVAVHCLAGVGRTGTVLAAYFVSTGLTADDAIQLVRAERPGSIETREQEEAVAEFARRLGR